MSLVTIYNSFSYLGNTKIPLMPTWGVSKNLYYEHHQWDRNIGILHTIWDQLSNGFTPYADLVNRIGLA